MRTFSGEGVVDHAGRLMSNPVMNLNFYPASKPKNKVPPGFKGRECVCIGLKGRCIFLEVREKQNRKHDEYPNDQGREKEKESRWGRTFRSPSFMNTKEGSQ